MTPVLSTTALTIGYRPPRQSEVRVAEELDLTLHRGELVCLLGPNGAGKSTLMRTIAAMQPPLAGVIRLNGLDLTALTPRQRAERISVVLTERPNLGLLNGYALVALGRHPHTDWTGKLTRYDEAMIRWAVAAVGAEDIAERAVMELSDGQRQKLMIARALAQEADLILLDEPTAFLDLPRRVEIMRLLRQLAAETDRAILISTHDLDLALRSADRLWLLAGGRIHAGTPEDLVLSGAFEAAFSAEGVSFDRLTGAFRVEQVTRGTVMVVGEGIAATWTRRALTRVGFTISEDAATICVEVRNAGDQTVWQAQTDGVHALYSSIGALIAGLTS